MLKRKKKRFHFEAWWALEDSCEREIRRLWKESSGGFMDNFFSLTVGMKVWADKTKMKRGKDVMLLTRTLEKLDGYDRSNEILAELID